MKRIEHNMSTSSTLSLDHYQLPAAAPASSGGSEQLCYVHCNICDTVLAVSVPASSLFKTVTVRCGHCSNLLPVNMRGLLLPAAPPNQFQLAFSQAPHSLNLLEEMSNPSPNMMVMNQQVGASGGVFSTPATVGLVDHHLSRPPIPTRPAPEKRQRIPSAYNRFIKEEIQRIKAENSDISHREAFSAAAKNWAHFPQIHFGLMPDHQSSVKKEANGFAGRWRSGSH